MNSRQKVAPAPSTASTQRLIWVHDVLYDKLDGSVCQVHQACRGRLPSLMQCGEEVLRVQLGIRRLWFRMLYLCFATGPRSLCKACISEAEMCRCPCCVRFCSLPLPSHFWHSFCIVKFHSISCLMAWGVHCCPCKKVFHVRVFHRSQDYQDCPFSEGKPR